MFEVGAYLAIGFIIAGVILIFDDLNTEKRRNDAILATYMVVLAWPILLPFFMVMGVFALKDEKKY